LFGLAILLGMAWAGEAQAAVSGGSRLLYYYTKKSFAPGAPDNSANTYLLITNNASSATRVGVKYYKGDDCAQSVGPVFQPVAANATVILDTTAQAPTFQEGVAEAFFVNDANAPIRFDAATGQSLIVDNSVPVALLKLPAASLYSDNRSGDLTAIADNTSPTSFAPIILTGQFLPPSITKARLVVFNPGVTPGTSSPGTVADVGFRQFDGSGSVTGTFDGKCGSSATLAQVRGQSEGDFAAAFPGGGVVSPDLGEGSEKGLVGWLIEHIAGANILMGEGLKAYGVIDPTAHP
jgi:hypothetical protein